MIKTHSKKQLVVGLTVAGSLLLGGIFFLNKPVYRQVTQEITKPSEERFLAPGKDWPSEKKAEDYFIEHLNMTPEEARQAREKSKDGTVMLRLRETSTLEGLLSNLEYYGFVRDKEALLYALEHTEDSHKGRTPGQNIEIGENTISLYSYYRISENMTAWEIADQLLNHPTYFAFDEYNYMFMP